MYCPFITLRNIFGRLSFKTYDLYHCTMFTLLHPKIFRDLCIRKLLSKKVKIVSRNTLILTLLKIPLFSYFFNFSIILMELAH